MFRDAFDPAGQRGPGKNHLFRAILIASDV